MCVMKPIAGGTGRTVEDCSLFMSDSFSVCSVYVCNFFSYIYRLWLYVVHTRTGSGRLFYISSHTKVLKYYAQVK